MNNYLEGLVRSEKEIEEEPHSYYATVFSKTKDVMEEENYVNRYILGIIPHYDNLEHNVLIAVPFEEGENIQKGDEIFIEKKEYLVDFDTLSKSEQEYLNKLYKDNPPAKIPSISYSAKKVEDIDKGMGTK